MSVLTTIVTFIIVFGILVVVHEFGHFWMARRSGILVREFSIGMGPKIVDLKSKGTTFTIRVLPIGGYVRMAGIDEEDDELKPGQQVILSTNQKNIVTKIDASNHPNVGGGFPFEVVKYDLVNALFIEGYQNGNEDNLLRLDVDHDATIVEANNVEVRIAPHDVQFQSAKLWKRMLTNFAGPFNNFVLAIVVFAILGVLQGSVPTNSNKVNVVDNGVAAKAGLKDNDIITKIDDTKINNWSEISENISNKANQNVKLTIQRQSQKKIIQLTPKEVNNGQKKVGMIGIETTSTRSLISRVLYGFTGTWEMTERLFGAIGQMFHGFSLNDLGGPVAIYATTSQATRQGFTSVLFVLAFLSLNLGIVNLFPIPALDGGKLLLNIIEAIRRKPIKPETENVITLIGFGFLMLLMILVTWNDIQRYFIK